MKLRVLLTSLALVAILGVVSAQPTTKSAAKCDACTTCCVDGKKCEAAECKDCTKCACKQDGQACKQGEAKACQKSEGTSCPKAAKKTECPKKAAK